MQARYYDADLGRFISTDPVAVRAGDVFNFNRYMYANDNPLNFVDPTGMQACRPSTSVGGVEHSLPVQDCGGDNPGNYQSPGQGGSIGPAGGSGEGGVPGFEFVRVPTEKPVNVTADRQPDDRMYCLRERQIRGIAGAVVGAAAGSLLGSESGPGALVSGAGGADVPPL